MCKFSCIVLHLFIEPWYVSFTIDLSVISEINAVICKSNFTNILSNYSFHRPQRYYIWHRPQHHVYMMNFWLAAIICHQQIDNTGYFVFWLFFFTSTIFYLIEEQKHRKPLAFNLCNQINRLQTCFSRPPCSVLYDIIGSITYEDTSLFFTASIILLFCLETNFNANF